MSATVLQAASSSRGEQRSSTRHCAREVATLIRFGLKTKASPRGASSPLELASETRTTGASCPWNLSTAELRDVLGRAAVARYFAQAEADALLAALERHATLVEDAPVGERLVPGDPGDDYLVALARAGGAQAIVTGDAHLLEAGVDRPAVTPGAFLARLEELGR